MKPKTALALIIICFLFVFAACETVAVPEEEIVENAPGELTLDSDTVTPPAFSLKPKARPAAPGAELYLIWSEESRRVTIVDKDGAVIVRGIDFEIVYNKESSAAVAITRTKYDGSVKKTALYDTCGNMIYDFDVCYYEGDSGSLIRRYDVVSSYGEDEWGNPVIEGYYVTIDMENGSPVDGEYRHEYFAGEDSDAAEKYYSAEGYNYFDGDVGIKSMEFEVGEKTWRKPSGYDEDWAEPLIYDLVDGDGNVLFGEASVMSVLSEDKDGRATAFFAEKDYVVYKLSRDGDVLAEYKLQERIHPSRVIGGGYAFADGKVFDAEFNIIGSGYIYADIIPMLPFWDGSYPPIHYVDIEEVKYIAAVKPSHGSYQSVSVYDIFDKDGKIVWENLVSNSSFLEFGPDRVALRTGFSRGLMDETGKWLYRESVFNSLDD